MTGTLSFYRVRVHAYPLLLASLIDMYATCSHFRAAVRKDGDYAWSDRLDLDVNGLMPLLVKPLPCREVGSSSGPLRGRPAYATSPPSSG